MAIGRLVQSTKLYVLCGYLYVEIMMDQSLISGCSTKEDVI